MDKSLMRYVFRKGGESSCAISTHPKANHIILLFEKLVCGVTSIIFSHKYIITISMVDLSSVQKSS